MNAIKQYRLSGGRRDLVAVVGESGADQYERYLRLLNWSGGIHALGLLLLGVGIGYGITAMWVSGLAIAIPAAAVYLACGVPIARTTSAVVDRSVWWCVDQTPTAVARFVIWVDGQLAAKSGAHLLEADTERDEAIALLNRRRASGGPHLRTLRARALWLIVVVPTGMVVYGVRMSHELNPPMTAQSSPTLSTITGLTGLEAALPGNGPGSLGALFDCDANAATTVAAQVANTVSGSAFRCTSASGRSVTWAYFAPPEGAAKWANAECKREHLPPSDAYVEGGAAAVTSDQTVLHNLRTASS